MKESWLFPKKIKWTQKFGTLEIALTIIGAVLYGLGAFSTMSWAIGFITLRPFAFIAVVWGVLFGPWVGGLAALIGNTFISDILAGWFGIGGVGGAVGNFLMAFIPGLLVSNPKNWKAIVLWGGIVGTLVTAVSVGGWIALMGFSPFMTLFTSVLIADVPPNLILAPIVAGWLANRVQKRGLYWRDRAEAKEEAEAKPQPV
jgi:energy-coupling factor transport system substrate-specific component